MAAPLAVGRSTPTDWLPPFVRDAIGVKPEPQTLNRQVLLERAGRISVPYLVDPKTGVEMSESAAIIEYSERTYAAWSARGVGPQSESDPSWRLRRLS